MVGLHLVAPSLVLPIQLQPAMPPERPEAMWGQRCLRSHRTVLGICIIPLIAAVIIPGIPLILQLAPLLPVRIGESSVLMYFLL